MQAARRAASTGHRRSDRRGEPSSIISFPRLPRDTFQVARPTGHAYPTSEGERGGGGPGVRGNMKGRKVEKREESVKVTFHLLSLVPNRSGNHTLQFTYLLVIV